MLDCPTTVPYVIKRYSNRKLYDPQTSRYVTLDDLKQLIHDGTELRVEDATSGEDLTSLTLAQILLEGERAHQNALPATLLHQLVKHGEAWYDFVQRFMRANMLDRAASGPGNAEKLWRQWAAFGGRPQPADRPQDAREPKSTKSAASSAAANLEAEIAALKEKLLALEKRVRPEKRARTRRGRATRGSGRPR